MGCDKSRCPAHDFHEKKSVVRTGGIANAINSVEASVDCSIKTDGVIGTADVVVDRAGYTDRAKTGTSFPANARLEMTRHRL